MPDIDIKSFAGDLRKGDVFTIEGVWVDSWWKRLRRMLRLGGHPPVLRQFVVIATTEPDE